jgi:hypothetical protein
LPASSFALTELVLCIVAVSHINPTLRSLQLAERFEPLAYHVAVDGISLIFAGCGAAHLADDLHGMSRGMISPGRLFAVLLLAEAGLVGMLVTMNVAWFAAFSALELWAVVYLLRRWASSRAEIHALARFVQYQAFGWALFAAGCLVLGWGHAEATGGRWSFDLSIWWAPSRLASSRWWPSTCSLRTGRTYAALPAAWLAAQHGAAWPDRRRAGADGWRQGGHLRHAAFRPATDAGGRRILAALRCRLRHGGGSSSRPRWRPAVNLRRLLAFAVVSHTVC